MAVLLGGSSLLLSCAGAQNRAPIAAVGQPAPVIGVSPQADRDASDSLDKFRSKLAGGLGGVSELKLAGKGWGPGLGPLLGQSEAVESVPAAPRP